MDYVTVSQMAERLGVTRAAIYNRIKAGTLDVVRPGHTILVRAREANKWERVSDKHTRCLKRICK
jgi:excisionase family DNA binding protein